MNIDIIPGTINIPQNIANSPGLSNISRLQKSIPHAVDTILIEPGEVRYLHPFSLPELIEDLESFVTTFQRYIQDSTLKFSDQIDNQIVRDMGLFYEWKQSNQFNINDKTVQNLITQNEALVSEVGKKLLKKLEIHWTGNTDAWGLIADALEKRNFG